MALHPMSGGTRQVAKRAAAVAPVLLCVAVAAGLRLFGLGARPLLAGEAVNSLTARQLARGGGYEQIAALHGPLQFFGTAAIFRVLGDGDVAARLLSALAGIALAALPFAFARRIGMRAAFAAGLMLAVSPSFVYYSRYASADVLLALLSLGLAAAIWRELDAPHRANLYLIAALLALLFVTTEMALVVTAIFVAYLSYRTAVDLVAQRREWASTPPARTLYERLGVLPNASAAQVRRAYKAAIAAADGRGEREEIADAYRTLTHDARRAAYDRRLARRGLVRQATARDREPGVVATATFASGAWLIVAAWPFIGGLRARLGLHRRPAAADPLLVTLLLALPFYGPLVQQLPFVGRRGFAGEQPIYYIGSGFGRTPGGEVPVMLITLAALFGAAMIAGLAWRWHAWVICWAIFYGITVTLFTAFYTDSGGLWTGLWGTLDYWSRPDARITARPDTYYATLLPAYELLPCVLAAAGAIWLLARGRARERILAAGASILVIALALVPASTPVVGAHRLTLELLVASGAVLALRLPEFMKFLAFWTAAAFFASTRIDTKEPWLALHVVLPLTLLAGVLLGGAVAAVRMPRLSISHMPHIAAMGAATAIVAFALVLAARGGVRVTGERAASGSAEQARVGALAPARTSDDVRSVLAAVERASEASGEGRDLPVVLDASEGFSQTWLWYLREYRKLQIEDMGTDYTVPADAVAIVSERDRAHVHAGEAALALAFVQQWSAESTASPGEMAPAAIDARAWLSSAPLAAGATSGEALAGVVYFPGKLSAAVKGGPAGAVLGASSTP
jgi:predicted membrane-bound mannosyltransferase